MAEEKLLSYLQVEQDPRKAGIEKIEYIDPNNYLGTDSQKIQNALNDAVSNGKVLKIGYNKTSLTNLWIIDTAILLKSNSKIVIENSTLKLSNSTRDNIFRSENCGFGINNSSSNIIKNLSIKGIGNAVIQGADNPRSTGDSFKTLSTSNFSNNFSYGSDAGVVGQTQTGDWRNIGILIAYSENVEVYGLSFVNTHCWAISFERSKYLIVKNLKFNLLRDKVISGLGTVSCKNLDGIDFRLGCNNIVVEDIYGFTDDDTVACTLIGNGTRSAGVYGVMEVSGEIYNSSTDDIFNVYINNIKSGTRENNVRLLNTSNTKMYNCVVKNVTDINSSQIQQGVTVTLGNSSPIYGGTSPLGNFNNISIENIVNRFAQHAIRLNNVISESYFKNIFQPNGTPMDILTLGHRQLLFDNIIVNTPNDGVPGTELVSSIVRDSSIRSGLFCDLNYLSYMNNMAWKISEEVDLNAYQFSGFVITPSSSLLNLPNGWSQRRYSMINIGTNNNTLRGQLLFNGETGELAYRTSGIGLGDFNPWQIVNRIISNTTTTALSLTQLNTSYPNFRIGDKIQCLNVSGGPIVYEKTSAGWIRYNVVLVT